MRPVAFAPALSLLLLAACAGRPDVTGRSGLHIADVAIANGAPSAALQVAQGILGKDPTDTQALVRAGEAQWAMGQKAQAEASFSRAISLDGSLARARVGLGRIQLTSSPADAAASFTAALAREPNDAAALTDLGVAQDLMGRHLEAQKSYRAALAQRPGLVSAEVDLGLSLALSGHARDGVEILRPVGVAPSASPRVREDLAAALAMAGDAGSAEQVLKVDLPPPQATAALAGMQALAASSP